MTKAVAWDAIGLDFWWRGRRSAKPARESLAWFTRGIGPDQSCLIVGGTSVSLIRRALARGGSVTVLDFSERVCLELQQVLGGAARVLHADVLAPPPELEDGFAHLLCDTLLNRFDGSEAERFERSAARLLVEGGELRATVKLGLYEMDRKLMALAASRSTPASFWDAHGRTIDYSRAGDLIDEGLVAHGRISRAALRAWYASRGREKRYEVADVLALFGGEAWSDLCGEPEPGRPDRLMVRARRRG